MTVAPANSTTAGLWKFARNLVGAVIAVSVRTKIVGIVISLVLVLGVAAILLVRGRTEELLIHEQHVTGNAIADEVAARTSTASGRFGRELPVGLESEISHHDDLVFVALVRDTAEDPIGLLHFRSESPGDVRTMLPGSDDPDHSHSDGAAGEVIHTFRSEPLSSGAVVVVGMGQAHIDEAVALLTRDLLLLVGMVGAGSVLGAGVLTWFLTRPLWDLVDLTKRLRAGDLSARAQPWAADELGALAVSFNEMAEGLEEKEDEAREFALVRQGLLESLLEAQESERVRISRLLHDSVGQSLGSVTLGLAQLEDDGTEQKDPELTRLRRTIGEAIEQVRELSHELRPAVLDDLGLGPALRRHADDFMASGDGRLVDVRVDLPGRLPRATETALYRIVQEATINAFRHGCAESVSVYVFASDGMVRAVVEDDGEGFDLAGISPSAVGLQSMRERVQMVDGTLSIETGSGGTTVFVEVPG